MKQKESLRSSVRRHIYYYLAIYDSSGSEVIGWLGDISKEGVMIVSEKKLELRSPLRILIELPKKEPFCRKKVALDVELLWRKPDTNPAYHCHGGLITHIPPVTGKVIGALLYMYGFLDDQKIESDDIVL